MKQNKPIIGKLATSMRLMRRSRVRIVSHFRKIELYRFQLYRIILEHGRSLAGFAAGAKGVDIVNFDYGV